MRKYIEILICLMMGAGFLLLAYYSYQHRIIKQAAWTPRQEQIASIFYLTPADIAKPVHLWEEK